MKRLILALLLLAPLPAQAQSFFREITTHWLDVDATARATTTGIQSVVFAVRLITDAVSGVFYAIAISGAAETAAAEQATAFFLPANVDRIVAIDPNSTIVAITVTSTGILWVTELSR